MSNPNYSPALHESTGLNSYNPNPYPAGARPASSWGRYRLFDPALDYVAALPPLTHYRLALDYERAVKDRRWGRGNVQWAYSWFIAEIDRQYRHIIERGAVEIYWISRDPYKDSAAMRADVTAGRLLVFRSGSPAAFGSIDSPPNDDNHPLNGLSPYHCCGQSLTWNDIFRAVHDLWGHAVGGYQFGPRGEFNATLAHYATFYHWAAREVLLAETLLQNSWFNFGPRSGAGEVAIDDSGDFIWLAYAADDARYIPPAARPYPPQLAFTLPLVDYRGVNFHISLED